MFVKYLDLAIDPWSFAGNLNNMVYAILLPGSICTLDSVQFNSDFA